MKWKKVPKISALIGFTALALGLAACSSGVAQKDYDAVQTQVAAEQQKSAQLQQQVSAKLQEAAQAQQLVTAAKSDATKLQDQITAREKEIAELNKAAGASAGITTLLGAKQVPPPTPRPTATPLPPGVPTPTAAPARVVPASYLQTLQLYIYADTVTAGPSESKYNIDAAATNAAPSCVLTSIFKRGMHLVWRFEIVDAVTGKRLTDKEMETAVVRLPSGDEIKGRFGRHGSTDDAPWFWTSAWDVPLDYPLGALDWTINAKAKDGKTGTFALWKVSIPERGIESRTQIVN